MDAAFQVSTSAILAREFLEEARGSTSTVRQLCEELQQTVDTDSKQKLLRQACCAERRARLAVLAAFGHARAAAAAARQLAKDSKYKRGALSSVHFANRSARVARAYANQACQCIRGARATACNRP